jgi:hypothetical protein
MSLANGPLSHVLSALDGMNKRLGKARNEFLAMKAMKDHFEATLVKSSPGESNAEKVVNAKADPRWQDFHEVLNRYEAEYEYLRVQFSILEKEYQAQYLELKLNDTAIKRGGHD